METKESKKNCPTVLITISTSNFWLQSFPVGKKGTLGLSPPATPDSILTPQLSISNLDLTYHKNRYFRYGL